MLSALLLLTTPSSARAANSRSGQEAAQKLELQQKLALQGQVVLPNGAALPPQSVLTVRVEDVGLADAPARLLGEFKQTLNAAKPELSFSIAVTRRDMDPRHRYAVRAAIHEAGQLRFTSTQFHPVWASGNPESSASGLQIPLQAVAPAAPAPLASIEEQALGTALPASFTGVLPCADCEGVQHRLTLRADGSYRLLRDYLGKSGAAFTEWGRWSVQPSQGLMPGRLQLQGAQQEAQHFVLMPATRQQPAALRLLDKQGHAFSSSANLDLGQTAVQDEGQEPLRLRGEFRYMADAASFVDCASGLRWPVLMAGDYLALERRYGELLKSPGAAVWVELQGRIAAAPSMEGPAREHVLVDQFIAADANASCAAPRQALPAQVRPPLASLVNTYWKLIEIDGRPLLGSSAQALGDFSLTLSSQDASAQVKSPCGRSEARYQLQGDTLKFSTMTGTMDACPAAAQALLQRLTLALQASSTYRMEGEHLMLIARGKSVARFESVYLR